MPGRRWPTISICPACIRPGGSIATLWQTEGPPEAPGRPIVIDTDGDESEDLIDYDTLAGLVYLTRTADGTPLWEIILATMDDRAQMDIFEACVRSVVRSPAAVLPLLFARAGLIASAILSEAVCVGSRPQRVPPPQFTSGARPSRPLPSRPDVSAATVGLG